MLPDARAIRIAENESRFRALNERLEHELEQYAEPGEEIEFICECGKNACGERLRLSLDEYEAVRADSRQFAVVTGHEIPDVEDVVGDHGRYVVVQKHPPTAPLVKELDPRRED